VTKGRPRRTPRRLGELGAERFVQVGHGHLGLRLPVLGLVPEPLVQVGGVAAFEQVHMWRRPTSTGADTHRVDAVGVAFRNEVSSTPSMATPAVGAGSSTSGVPYTVTADMTAHHEQPSSEATPDTGRACWPTCRHAHNPARRVNW
jgi:hypothetical protein